VIVSLFWGIESPAATNDLFLETTLSVRLGEKVPVFVKRSRMAQVNWQALEAGEHRRAGSERSVQFNCFGHLLYGLGSADQVARKGDNLAGAGSLAASDPGDEDGFVDNVSFTGKVSDTFSGRWIPSCREVIPAAAKERDPIPIVRRDLAETFEKKELGFSKDFSSSILS
jgi:hypothetical protein